MNQVPRLFAFWLGDNAMSAARRSARESLAVSGLEVAFITRDTLHEYIDSDRLHPAFWALNLAHQSDYLRCYCMHFFGGGYSDIKWVEQSWRPAVAHIESRDDLWAGGYPEVSAVTVANIDHFPAAWPATPLQRGRLKLEKRWYAAHYTHLMATNALYCKPDTPLTRAWWSELNRRMDGLAPALAEHPAQRPKEKPGERVEGRPSEYPVPWTFLLGSILHPLSYRYRRHIANIVPQPGFDHPVLGNYDTSDGQAT